MSKIEKVIHIRGSEGVFQYELNDRIQKLQDEGLIVDVQYGSPIESKHNTNVTYNAILICRKMDKISNCDMVQYTQEQLGWGKECIDD